MANKYTRPVQSQYIPQYSPMNMQALQYAGENLWKRQEQGLEQYDALQESINSLDVLESDKTLLNKERERINQSLSQFSDTNDFIDAMPAIRKQARNLSKSITEGDLAIALENKESAMETFEAIEASDWSASEKQKAKDLYLKDYKDAATSGRLGTMAIPDTFDTEKIADEIAKEVEETEREVLTTRADPITERTVRVAETRKGRDPEAIKENITARLRGNEDFLRAATFEAQLAGKETDEEINEYINEKISTQAALSAHSYGRTSTTLSDIQWDDFERKAREQGGDSDPSNLWMQTSDGVLASRNIMDNFNDEVEKYHSTSNKNDRQAILSGIKIAAAGMLQEKDENGESLLSQEEYDTFLKKLDAEDNVQQKLVGNVGISGQPIYKGVEFKDQEFIRIKNKINEWVQNKGDIIGKRYTIPNENKRDKVTEALSTMNPSDFTIIGSSGEERLDEGTIEETTQNKFMITKKGEFQGLHWMGDNHRPTLNYHVNFGTSENPDFKDVYIEVKPSTQLRIEGRNTYMRDLIKNQIDESPQTQQFLDANEVAALPADGSDVYEKMPYQMRANIGSTSFNVVGEKDSTVVKPINKVMFEPREDGYALRIGSKQEDSNSLSEQTRTITGYDVFKSSLASYTNYMSALQQNLTPKQRESLQYAKDRILERMVDQIEDLYADELISETQRKRAIEGLNSLSYKNGKANVKIPKSVNEILQDALAKDAIFKSKIQGTKYLTGE